MSCPGPVAGMAAGRVAYGVFCAEQALDVRPHVAPHIIDRDAFTLSGLFVSSFEERL